MAATTYTWNTIASTQTDGDSPLDETLMEGVRQNLISLEEWMGDGYAQAKDHDHDGVNSKGVILVDGSVTNAKIAGGQITFTFPLATITAGSYADVASASIYIPANITKIYTRVRYKVDVGSTAAIRIRIGSVYSTAQTGLTAAAYTTLAFDITPGGGDKGSYVEIHLQAQRTAGGGNVYTHKDTEGIVSWASASYFADA